MGAPLKTSARDAWAVALEDFKSKEKRLNAAALKLVGARDLAENSPDWDEWCALAGRLARLQCGVSDIQRGLADLNSWWHTLTDYVPGLAIYRNAGIVQFAVPVGIGALYAVTASVQALANRIDAFVAHVQSQSATENSVEKSDAA